MFVPAVPLGGLSGWAFLSRTRDAQSEAFAAAPSEARLTAYFRETIAQVTSAAQLVEDRQLLTVALGAFGLEADIDSRAFIREVLDGGTLNGDGLANRLADSRYERLSAAFGFGDFDVPRTQLSDFADEIVTRYEARAFEAAVGSQNNSLRLALNLEGGLADVLDAQSTQDGRWFALMGDPPLRQVVEVALGLPTSFGSADLDRQLEEFKDRASRLFGSGGVETLAEPENRERLIQLFLVRQDAQSGTGVSPGAVALALLQSG